MYVIYIWNHLGNPITQIFELSSLDIKLKLNDISTAVFTISSASSYCNYENFKEFNRVLISKVINNTEEVMFDGVIRGITSDLNETKITLNSGEFLLKKKILFVDKSYINQSILSILTDLVSHINSRDIGFINLNCNIDVLVSREYKMKKNLLDILKDLAGDIYEFNFLNNTLTFSETIGKDKSSGSNIVLFEFDINTPESRTIRKAEIDYDSDNITNSVIGEDGEGESSESILEFGRIEEGFSTGNKLDLLNERKNSIRELNIEPMIDDFFVCNVGDIVKTYIEVGNDVMYYNGGLKVIEKSFKTGTLNTINIKLNTGKVRSLSLLETISNLKTRVTSLEI